MKAWRISHAYACKCQYGNVKFSRWPFPFDEFLSVRFLNMTGLTNRVSGDNFRKNRQILNTNLTKERANTAPTNNKWNNEWKVEIYEKIQVKMCIEKSQSISTRAVKKWRLIQKNMNCQKCIHCVWKKEIILLVQRLKKSLLLSVTILQMKEIQRPSLRFCLFGLRLRIQNMYDLFVGECVCACVCF